MEGVVIKPPRRYLKAVFYKNPVFLTLISYIIFIFLIYLNMSETTKKSYIFNDKFRDDLGTIHWLHILTYPYEFQYSVNYMILFVLRTPIIWYSLIYTLLAPAIINTRQKSQQAYFYMLMFSYLVIFMIFFIHYIIFNFISKPKDTTIEIKISNEPINLSYDGFYRTQWILILWLSPIYVCLLLYIIRNIM
jgi:hypothetical protein